MADRSEYRTPGQLLKALLAERGWTQGSLAIVLGVDASVINRICSDQRSIDAKQALSLNRIFGVPARDFLDLQTTYELAKAEIEEPPPRDLLRRAQLFGDLPLSAMLKRGWLDAPSVKDVERVEEELTRFFGASSLDGIALVPHAAKKTDAFGVATPAQSAWVHRVRKIASEMMVSPFSEDALRRALTQLDRLLLAPEEARHVARTLAEAGVRFVVVETLPSAKIDGACLWLDDRSPVVGMSLRFDRIDNFWFVLRHELEHVLRGDGKDTLLLDDLEGGRASASDASVPEQERLANAAAAEFCVPQKRLQSFIARKDPFFRERDILGFAKTLNIHPGLVAGQLQHNTKRYDRFRKHQAKIRQFVTSTAVTDGWGDVAPTDA